MAGKYDFAQIKADADMIAIIGQYVKLKKDGPHFKGCCPFHAEDTASFVVTDSKGIYKCFGCGEGGDIFDFFIKKFGKTYAEAVEIVVGNAIAPPLSSGYTQRVLSEPVEEWIQAEPNIWPQNIEHPRYGRPVAFWEYRNSAGVIISYDCRFEYTDDKGLHKDVIPLTFATNGTKSEWRWKGMDKPRSLSSLDKLTSHPDKPVMIVEGRKTQQGAETLLTNPIVVTWQGGGRAVEYTDWSPLKGRKCTIWQDNDFAGYETAIAIQAELKKIGASLIMFVHNPKSAPKGWDAYDAHAEGWDKAAAKKYLNQNIHEYPQTIENPKEGSETVQNEHQEVQVKTSNDTPMQQESVEQEVNSGDDRDDDDVPSGVDKGQGNAAVTYAQNPFFRFLGFISSDGKLQHCFYNFTTKTIIKLSVSGMGKGSSLLELAPLDFWEQRFNKTNGFDLPAAVNWIVAVSQALGIFRTDCMRGRGAWMEGTTPVVHAGNRLIIDGKNTDIQRHHSEFIYEQGAPLGFDVRNPLSRELAREFLALAKMIKWKRDVDAILFCGLCVISPICGALDWRPHGWITGASGSGKSWIMKKIVKLALGDCVLHVQGNTSEAGIRQTLKRDARPVMFDEAEGEDRKAAEQIQSVLNLMRSASAEDGGDIVKGSASSGADAYQIRSCFIFASIGLQINQQSDRTRITVMALDTFPDDPKGKTDSEWHFSEILKFYHNLCKGNYMARLRARTLSMIPVILKNAKVFSSAAASVLGVQRTGDQLGSLLAGAYSLISDEEVSYAAAVEWVKRHDWEREIAQTETKDEKRLLSHIMEQFVQVELHTSRWDRPIGELICFVAGTMPADPHVTSDAAHDALMRNGIKVDRSGGMVMFCNNSTQIKKLLRDSPWVNNYSEILFRIPGAGKTEAIRFSGIKSRAITVPLKYIID